MTKEQIENMRRVMFSMFGEFALFAPDAAVVAFRDELQRRANELPEADTSNLKPCSCKGSCRGRDGLSRRYKCSQDGKAGAV